MAGDSRDLAPVTEYRPGPPGALVGYLVLDHDLSCAPSYCGKNEESWKKKKTAAQWLSAFCPFKRDLPEGGFDGMDGAAWLSPLPHDDASGRWLQPSQ